MNKNFTDSIVQMGREHGFTMGLARALEILREQGLEVDHPARTAVYHALMIEKPAKVSYLPPEP